MKNIQHIPSFGIEIEFFIVDEYGFPVLNSNKIIKNECLKVDPSLSIVQELSSFQIEINPGPWLLNSDGLKNCINSLQRHYKTLKSVVNIHGWELCESVTPKYLTQEIIDHPDYFSAEPRFIASANYFENRNDIVLQNNSIQLKFPGESIIGCINEIHIHAQLTNDSQSIALYNYLNEKGLQLTSKFNSTIKINEQLFHTINSIELFEQANGEWNVDESIYRVGNLPYSINTHEEYEKILKTFAKIPIKPNKFLNLESSVYFWTRLRGKPNNLRIEFRPMEMGQNWLERVKYLYNVIRDYELNPTPHSNHSKWSNSTFLAHNQNIPQSNFNHLGKLNPL